MSSVQDAWAWFPIKILGSHPNFQNEKSRIERLLVEDKEHIEYMLPKFNCEVNPIKRYGLWKSVVRRHTADTESSLRGNVIHPALDSVTLESMHPHFRKVRHYMYAYLEGVPGGSDLEKLVKNYKKIIKLHRRISELQ